MKKNSNPGSDHDQRLSYRRYLDLFHSVELSIAGMPYCYQFKLRDRSKKGMCVLVQEKSDIMGHLNIGDILDVKYWPSDKTVPPENLKTQIRHITKTPENQSAGHYYVGLMVVETGKQ
ncbi:MAG: hypothetical protein GY737_03670 [Desulfobacteraceae bacterium]|nr:hypothetical protein [Desulfobacteraceae bacterium]